MGWFCKDLKNKKCLNVRFFNVSKIARNLINKCKNKFLKFNVMLAIATIIITLFIAGKIACNILPFNESARKGWSYFFVLKSSLLYQETFDKIALKLMIHDAKVKGNPLKLIRLGKNNDCGYVVPIEALEASDALLGYGIDNDISFEREFCQRFDKPSFGFDCGIPGIETGDNRCHFFSECIGTSDYIYSWQTSSGHVSSFSDQLQRLKLTDKKVFIKMDIEGAEFEVLNGILDYSNNITGIVLELHISLKNAEKALDILSSLERNFVLIHLHGNNVSLEYFKTKYAKNHIPFALELTYVNKNLLSSYEISDNQKHPKPIDQPAWPYFSDCEFEITPNAL
ncbi:MAG: FkbM family methyltransferase [Alphaproteobacteria bacterium]|nr:FkbM family methyltransferase [Alphaproteobacteria bacterium]